VIIGNLKSICLKGVVGCTGMSQPRGRSLLLLLLEQGEVSSLELREKSHFSERGRDAAQSIVLTKPSRFDRLKVTPQFSAVLPDLVASFATIE
jgi:hypothetical protein